MSKFGKISFALSLCSLIISVAFNANLDKFQLHCHYAHSSFQLHSTSTHNKFGHQIPSIHPFIHPVALNIQFHSFNQCIGDYFIIACIRSHPRTIQTTHTINMFIFHFKFSSFCSKFFFLVSPFGLSTEPSSSSSST